MIVSMAMVAVDFTPGENMTAASSFLSSPRPVTDTDTFDLGAFGKEHVNIFKALLACKDTDRYTLDGVEVESRNGHTFLTATNGHILLVVETSTHSGGCHGRRCLTGDSVAEFVSSKGHAPLEVSEWGAEYPDVRAAFPTSFNEAESVIGLSATYIDTLSKVLKALGQVGKKKSCPVTMQHNGSLSPVVFSVESESHPLVGASLIIMPMRLD